MSTPAEIAAAAVDACYAAFGVDATYTPPGGGSPVACIVLKDSSDRHPAAGRGSPIMQGHIVEVRKSEIAAPARGGVLLIGSESLTIQSDPETRDAERLVWICTVA